MTEVPSKRRCYPVEYCAECQGRLSMRHLYKPYGMMSYHNIVDADSEFANRWVCTETEDNREIKLHPSLDFPDWCPLKVIPDDPPIIGQQGSDPMPVWKNFSSIPINEWMTCEESIAKGVNCKEFPNCSCCSYPKNDKRYWRYLDDLAAWKLRQQQKTQQEHDTAIRNAVLDELGILHGEDAKRFTEQLDHPEPLTPEARDLVMRAKEIAQATRKEKGCPYWNPDVNIYPDEPGNHCTCQFSHIRKNEREKVLDKIVLMTLDRPCTEDYSPNLLGCSGCPFAISYDNGEDCVIRSLRSAATPTVSNKGDINGS